MRNLEIKTELNFLESNEAFASVELNPVFRYAKFILTDDLPNLNKQRIPKEEFPNLIKSGKYAPVKMALGRIKQGHEDSVPIGTICDLVEDENKIIGIAALWEKEREEDVKLLKEMRKKGVLPQLSWEVYYTDSSEDEEGNETLTGTTLRAATLVGLPAYGGRTPILSIASKNLEDKLDELEKLQGEYKELENQLKALETKVSELATANEELKTSNEELTQYKNEVEQAKEKVAKLKDIKEKFVAAGLEKDEQFFVDNEEMLLGFSDTQLDFHIKSLVIFKETNSSVNSDKTKEGLPNLSNTDKTVDAKKLAQKLRETK